MEASVYSIHLWLSMLCFLMPQTSEKQERPTYWVDGVDKFSGLAELHEALPEVIQWSLHQNLLLLVVIQQVIPKWLFRQSFRVPNNNYPIPMEEQTVKLRSAYRTGQRTPEKPVTGGIGDPDPTVPVYKGFLYTWKLVIPERLATAISCLLQACQTCHHAHQPRYIVLELSRYQGKPTSALLTSQ